MSFEELLRNPEKYRVGENYRATNTVFPVSFDDQLFVVKKPAAWSSVANAYYVLQDRFLFGTRQLSTTAQRFQQEAIKLAELEGTVTPHLVAYDGKTLVREYLHGKDFRSLESNDERKRTLEGAIEGLERIHDRGVTIGDAHIKNTLLGSNGKVCWIDLDGVFDETGSQLHAMAQDFLKAVYSTYSVTRNPEITLYVAQLVTKNCSVPVVREELRRVVKETPPGLGLWFATRVPGDGKLDRDIRRILRG